MPEQKQKEVLSDPWDFANWQENLPIEGNRSMFHIFRHLLFPDYYELVSSGKKKKRDTGRIQKSQVSKWSEYP